MLIGLRRRLLQRGEFNWLVLAVLAGAAVVIYVAAIFLPPWSRNRRVTAALREACFQAYNFKDRDNDIKAAIIAKRIKLWGKDTEPFGEYPHFEQQDIIITRDTTEATITIELSYTVTVPFPLLEQSREITYEISEIGTTLSPAAEAKKKGKSMLEQWFE